MINQQPFIKNLIQYIFDNLLIDSKQHACFLNQYKGIKFYMFYNIFLQFFALEHINILKMPDLPFNG